MDKSFIRICANCQKEFPEVDSAVKGSLDRINFSHGVCERHSMEMLKQMGKDDSEIQLILQRMRERRGSNPPVPDLKEHPEIVKQYSQGIFTPEDYKKAQSPISSETTLKEFFLKRSGLIS